MYNQNLKTINPYFSQTWAGVKLYEIRNNDRNFREGQQYILREYEEKLDCYTGRSIFIEILLVMDDSRFLKEGFVHFNSGY